MTSTVVAWDALLTWLAVFRRVHEVLCRGLWSLLDSSRGVELVDSSLNISRGAVQVELRGIFTHASHGDELCSLSRVCHGGKVQDRSLTYSTKRYKQFVTICTTLHTTSVSSH